MEVAHCDFKVSWLEMRSEVGYVKRGRHNYKLRGCARFELNTEKDMVRDERVWWIFFSE